MAEGIENIRQSLNKIIDVDNVIARAIFASFDEHSQRIFLRGQDANLKTLKYKGKAFYLNFSDPKNAGRFARKLGPKGKDGKSKFKNGKKKKTTYFSGYSDFKKKQGFSQLVNFFVTGRLNKDYAVRKDGPLRYEFSVLNEENAKKMDGHEGEAIFNTPIYQLSEKDLDIFDEFIEKELDQII